ncbi:hypothetical protein BC828DRAFT_380906 [Blastocladiella britannica]|nr:hypothetical protein BC828DRAFT_380906 [Blastocladiella britannica]
MRSLYFFILAITLLLSLVAVRPAHAATFRGAKTCTQSLSCPALATCQQGVCVLNSCLTTSSQSSCSNFVRLSCIASDRMDSIKIHVHRTAPPTATSDDASRAPWALVERAPSQCSRPCTTIRACPTSNATGCMANATIRTTQLISTNSRSSRACCLSSFASQWWSFASFSRSACSFCAAASAWARSCLASLAKLLLVVKRSWPP